MALIVPYNTNAGIQTANAGAAAQQHGAAAFLSPGQENLGRGIQALAGGIDRLSGVVFDAEIRKRDELMELQLVEDMQRFQSDSQSWSDGYRQQYQGKDAVNAGQDAQAFYKEKVDALRERWQGNERAQLYIQKHAGGMAVSGVDAMRDYGNREQEVWKDSVFKGEQQTFLQSASDPNTSPEQIGEAAQTFMRQQTAYFMGKGLDPTEAAVKAENLYKEAINSNTYNRLAMEARTNPAESLRVLSGKPRSVNLPKEAASLAEAAAKKYGVEEALVKAVIMQESGGRAGAVSSKGARGLMQLMPGTAKDLAVNPDDPAQNVDGGARYLKQMLDRYDGDQRLALMAYNWGPGNVDAFLKTGKGKGGGDVPLETRQYVNRILGSDEAMAAEVLRPEQRKKIQGIAEESLKAGKIRAAEEQYASFVDAAKDFPTLEERKTEVVASISRVDDKYTRGIMEKTLKDDFERLKTLQQAGDMRGLVQAKESTRGMSPLQIESWLDANWQGSPAGKEKALEELTSPAKKETPKNTRSFNNLMAAIERDEFDDADKLAAAAWTLRLTAGQTEKALKHYEQGGNRSKIYNMTQDVWNELNPGKNKTEMPFFIPELALELIDSDKPIQRSELRKVVATLAMQGGGLLANPLYEEMRNGTQSSWTIDEEDITPEMEAKAKSIMTERARALGLSDAQTQAAMTPEWIANVIRDDILLKKYGKRKKK